MKAFRVLPLAACILIASCGGPPIKLEMSGKNIIVHLETLADYPTKIDRIVITKENHPEEKVFEASSEDGAQIHRFVIHAGTNDFSAIQRPYSGNYRMLIPNGNSFVPVAE